MSESLAAAQLVAAYDAIAYPAGVFRQSHPDRMAVVARLHGLSPPPIETARVLEIGGGDGLNAISVAAAYTDAHFLNIDLSPPAVAKGQALIRAAGLDNARNEVMDILDAETALDGPFDYVLAHGVYAWVPAHVRAAMLRLIARVLTSNGVAFLSYNTAPRGYLRMALREMVLREVVGIEPVPEMLAAAQAMLAAYAVPRDDDKPYVVALREEAKRMADNRPASLYHDELTPSYHPQAIRDVVQDSAAAGLAYLGEAEPGMVRHGILDDDAADRSAAAVARGLEADDYRVGRAFRSSLFVRGDVAPVRRLDLAAMADLYLAMPVQRSGEASFTQGKTTFEVADAAAADRIEAIARAFPRSVRVGDHFAGDRELDFVLRLFEAGLAELSTLPPRFAATAGERPTASALARAIAAGGGMQNVTLDQRYLDFGRAGARAFIQLLDGTRDRAALAAAWAAHPEHDDMTVEAGLAAVAGAALLVR